jgi:hypothetical protein
VVETNGFNGHAWLDTAAKSHPQTENGHVTERFTPRDLHRRGVAGLFQPHPITLKLQDGRMLAGTLTSEVSRAVGDPPPSRLVLFRDCEVQAFI